MAFFRPKRLENDFAERRRQLASISKSTSNKSMLDGELSVPAGRRRQFPRLHHGIRIGGAACIQIHSTLKLH